MSFIKSNTIDASGGTITYVNGYKIHTFTTVGTSTFTINSGSGSAKVLIVAGGGGGGYDRAAGGGGGGVVYYSSQSLSTGTYTVTVGDGGTGATSTAGNGANGGSSSMTGLTTAVGGGGGGTYAAGSTGGSGGGGHGQTNYAGGTGTSGQGNAGGAGTPSNSGGGGGAGGVGAAGGSGTNPAGSGNGGVGLQYSISGTATYYGGGGGGSIGFDSFSGTSGNGLGGLGGGGNSGQTRGANGSAGTANTGGGGGGGANIPQGSGGKGGSGIVIISYPYQTSMRLASTGTIQFTSRPILPAVLVNPGAQTFTNGGTVTVAQTALEPANGITWSLAPTGQGISVTSSTDYALTLSTPSAVTQNLFTVSATNKAGLTTVAQFTGATPIFNRISASASGSVVGVYSLRALRSLYSRVVQIRSSGFVYPPIAMTSDNFTATGTYNGVTNGVYISSASSAWGGSEFPFSAFDKNFNASRWTTSSSPYNGTTGAYGGGFSTTISGSAYSGEWLQLKVPSATVITSYTIYTSSVDPQRTPVDFKVAGSNDGTTWTVIDTQTGITSWLSSSTSLTFTVTSSPPAYLYFRLVTNKNGGTGSNGYLSIGEWVINNVPANTDFYADTLGNLTTASGSGQALTDWLGGATGYVTTLYDQTSNGYNLSQATTANQPAINLTTTPYSMIFNGSSTWIYNSSVPFNMGAGSFTLRYVVSNNTGGCVLFKAIGTAFTWATAREKKFWLGNGTTSETSTGNYPSHVGNSENYSISSTAITASVKNSIVHKATATNNVPIYINGNSATLGTNNISMSTDAGNYLIIGRGGNAAYYNGNLFELQLFSTPLSDADRLLLEN